MSSDDSNMDDSIDTYHKFRYNLEKVQEALLAKKGKPWKSFFDMSPLEKYWAIHYGESEDIEKMRAFGFDNIIRLDKRDMAVFGIFPETDPFYAVVCDICHAVIKPNSIRNHLGLRHENQRNGSRSHYPYNLTETSTARSLESLGFRPCSSRASQQYDEIYTPIIQPATSAIVVVGQQTIRKQTASKTVKNIRPTLFGPKGSSTRGMIKSRIAKKNLDGTTVTSSSSSSSSPCSMIANKSGSNSPDNYLFVKSGRVGSIAAAIAAARQKSTQKPKISLKSLLYDPDKHCGCVSYHNGVKQAPCIRSLTCTTHSLLMKRLVSGRSRDFDFLLAEKRSLRLNDDSTSSSSSSEQLKIIKNKMSISGFGNDKKSTTATKTTTNENNLRETDYLPATSRALSPFPTNLRPITYADVLKMIIPPRNETATGRHPVEVVSHSYRTVESDPYDPNDPYAEYRLTLPRSERFKFRIQVLIRTVDTMIESDEEYDLDKVTRTYHDFRNISLLTETSYWKLDREKLTQSESEPNTEITKEELQRAVQAAVRTKYEKEATSEKLSIEFGDRMSEFLSNESNSKIIRKICQTNDLRKVHLKSSLAGLMDLTNQDFAIRESLNCPIPPDAIFDFHIPDEFISSVQLTEVEILPEDLAQDEGITELFNNATPTEPITLEGLLSVFRTESGIVKKPPRVYGGKRPAAPPPPPSITATTTTTTIDTDPQPAKKMTFKPTSIIHEPIIGKKQLPVIYEEKEFENEIIKPIVVEPMIIDDPPEKPQEPPTTTTTPPTIKIIDELTSPSQTPPIIFEPAIEEMLTDENIMTVDEPDINEIINFIDEPIESIPGLERSNASPIDFLFDMYCQPQSLSSSTENEEDDDDDVNFDRTESDEEESEDGIESDDEMLLDELPIDKIIPEPIQTIELICNEYDHLIPSSLIDGLCTTNSTDIGPITMELPDMLFQESPIKINDVSTSPIPIPSPIPTPSPIQLIINELIEPIIIEPIAVVAAAAVVVEEKQQTPIIEEQQPIQPIQMEPEVIEIIDDDEDILEIIYLGKRPESLFKKPDQLVGNFPEFDSTIIEMDTAELELPVVNSIRRAKEFPGVRKWHTELPSPINIPSTLQKRCGGGLTTNKKKLPIRKALLNRNTEKTSNNLFEMNNNRKNGETSSATNLFRKSMQLNQIAPIKVPVPRKMTEEIVVIDDDDDDDAVVVNNKTDEAIQLHCRHGNNMEMLDVLIKSFDEYMIRKEKEKKKLEMDNNIIPVFPKDTDDEQRKDLEAKISHCDTEKDVRRTKATSNKQRLEEQQKKMQHRATCKKISSENSLPSTSRAEPILCDCEMEERKNTDDYCDKHNQFIEESRRTGN